MCEHDQEPAWERPGPKDDENIWIPEWNLAELEKKLAKLNKRARKLEQAEVTFDIVGEKMVERKVGNQKVLTKWLEIEFTGQGPKINGWKFLGTLDHKTLPGKVIVNTVPGETIPEQFFNSAPVCDHCEKNRRRNETFILQNVETGEYQRIGRQCVRDFIGYDVKQVMWVLTYIKNLVGSFGDEDSDWFSGGGTQWDYFSATEVLETAAACIDKHGWTSRGKAYDLGGTATADDVLSVYYPPKPCPDSYTGWIKSLDLQNGKWTEIATAARAWLKEQPNNNEYMNNLHAINEGGSVPGKLFGYWCSLVATYQRAMEKTREAKKQKRVSEYVGEIKQRQEFTVEVTGISPIDGYYGVVDLHRMMDHEGRTLVWFANTNSGMEAGHKYKIVGTVKKHEERNNWKQTSLNRVKVIEEVEASS